MSAVDEAYGNCDAARVEDEKKTPCVQMLEVVAAVVVLQVEAKLKSAPPEPVPHAEALAVTVPSAPTWRQRVPVPPADETTRLVVEAVVAVMAVVEAYGNMLATELVEVIEPPTKRFEDM